MSPASPAESAQPAASAAGIGGKREALPAWPADSVPNAAEAERAVGAVLDGTAGGLGPEIVARIKSDLTDVERAAFAGDAPEDLLAFRVAAALRWRLAAAVLTAPRTGRFDAAAVAALLADTDAVLAEVDRAGAGAPEDVTRAVSTIRAGLVREALALGNIVQRLSAAAEAGAGAAGETTVKAIRARVLSISAGDAPRREERRSSRKLWVALVLAAAVAAGFHGWSLANRPAPLPRPDGAPANTIASVGRSGRSLVATRDGKPLSEADLTTLRNTQKARGNRVVEVASGVYAIEPESAPPRAR